MKTAVSIPNNLFFKAERMARRTKKSRSRLLSDALEEYIARHAPDAVTEGMNSALDDIATDIDPFVHTASQRILEQVEW